MQPQLRLIDPGLTPDVASGCHLSINWNAESLTAIALDVATGTYLGIEQFRYADQHKFERWTEQLNTCFAHSTLLKNKFRTVSATIEHGLFTLVPAPVFVHGSEYEYLSFNHMIHEEDKVTEDHLPNLDIRNVYLLPETLENALKNLFPQVKVLHGNSILAEGLAIADKHSSETRIALNFRKTSFDLIVLSGKKLKFFNAFDYQSPEDVAYYLLHTLDQLEINPEQHKVGMLGEVKMNDNIYDLLNQYISDLAFLSPGGNLKLSAALESLNGHQFYNLFNQYLCV